MKLVLFIGQPNTSIIPNFLETGICFGVVFIWHILHFLSFLQQNEMTPLYMAAQENHIKVAKELLYHNADPRLAASVSRYCSVIFRYIVIVYSPFVSLQSHFSFLIIICYSTYL